MEIIYSIGFIDDYPKKIYVTASDIKESIILARQKSENKSPLLSVFANGQHWFIRDYDGNPFLKPYFDAQQKKYGNL